MIFSAAATGVQEPKTIKGKTESLSLSQSRIDSFAIILLLVGVVILGRRRKKKSCDGASKRSIQYSQDYCIMIVVVTILNT